MSLLLLAIFRIKTWSRGRMPLAIDLASLDGIPTPAPLTEEAAEGGRDRGNIYERLFK